MTLTEFIESDGHSFTGALRALWLAGRGDWNEAHDLAQADNSRNGAWVHAYLHRAEGDTANAGYWYRQAGLPTQHGELREEWEAIVADLLQQVR